MHTDSISTVNSASPTPISITSGTIAVTVATRSTSVVPPVTDINPSTTNTEILPQPIQKSLVQPEQPCYLMLNYARNFCEIPVAARRMMGRLACSGLFSFDHYIEPRAQASFLTHDELDLTLMGSTMSTLLTDDVF